LIQLSTRLKTNDGLWFSFFHELAHILKHSKKEEFIDFDNTSNSNDKEIEADLFASEKLIPNEYYRQFIQKGDFTKQSIIEFAKKISVGKDIVAGRLAHDKYITWQEKNNLTTHIELVKNA
jgi:HTH-type transcriptional regulator/antitoxin HigA